MTTQPDLRIVDPEAGEPQPQTRPAPRVFVRTVPAPPGLPWDQARAADLEARMGAPLPLNGVAYQVRRLDGWAPGRPARFAAFYVRAAEIGERLSTTVEVDGAPVDVQFVSERERRRQARTLLTGAGVAGGLAVVLALALLCAVQARIQASARLDTLEQQADSRLRQAQKLAALKLQARALDAAGARGASLVQVLDDLAVVSAAKAPNAHIQAFHWDRGYMGVEVRGDAQPFAAIDRQVQRADKPVRPDVWLWGVAPPAGRRGPANATGEGR